MKDILDLHTHTIASGHAYNTLYEMIHSASEKGLSLFGSTDHGPKMPGSCNKFYFINLRVIPRTIYNVNILMGAELNILDYNGKVDLPNNFLKRLDYSVASLHEPCYAAGNITENTNACLGALANPYVTIIGHPDDSRFPLDYDTLTAAAAQHHKLLEVNSSSLHPESSRQNARANYLTMLEFCRKHKTSIVINSDAHVEADVGNHQRAWELLEEINFPEELIINTSIEKVLPYIPKLKEYL